MVFINSLNGVNVTYCLGGPWPGYLLKLLCPQTMWTFHLGGQLSEFLLVWPHTGPHPRPTEPCVPFHTRGSGVNPKNRQGNRGLEKDMVCHRRRRDLTVRPGLSPHP